MFGKKSLTLELSKFLLVFKNCCQSSCWENEEDLKEILHATPQGEYVGEDIF